MACQSLGLSNQAVWKQVSHSAKGLSPTFASVNALAVQNDGKVILGGYFTNFNGVALNSIVRVHPDGNLDTNYTTTGGMILAMAPAANGQLFVAGDFTEFGGVLRDRIARLNQDGSVDPAFVPNAGFKGSYPEIFAVAVQSDGKIVVGGTFHLESLTNQNIARCETDGRLDAAFRGHDYGSVLALAAQADGKILAGGSFVSFDGASAKSLVRLNPDGSLDAGFDQTLLAAKPGSPVVDDILVEPDGKVLVVGGFNLAANAPATNIVRLNPDGTRDPSFQASVGTIGGPLFPLRCARQSGGKILVADGQYLGGPQGGNGVIRLKPDGSLDAEFRTMADDMVYDSVCSWPIYGLHLPDVERETR